LQGFLEDITQQTAFAECELFLLNANSPENETDIVTPFLEKYDNIRYDILDEDPGIYDCWNFMIQHSNSEYITNANVDDKLFPNCIEEHVKFLDENQNIDIAYCLNIVSYSPETSYKNFKSDVEVFPTAPYSYHLLKQINLPHNHPVWRRSLHDKYGYFSKDYQSGSDWEFWLRCGMNGVQMHLIESVLGIYYKNPEGMSTKKQNMQRNLQEVQDIKAKYSGTGNED
jgi:glycosyltransferase involved in cell wall biosynthesis